MDDCVITNISFDPTATKPTCVLFQNGKTLNGKENEFSCGLYTNEETPQDIFPTLASDNLIYTGSVDRSSDVFNTFIAIRNRKIKEMRLVAVDEAMLKSHLPKQRDILDSTMMEVNKRAITELNKEFGSKKTKRFTENLEKYKVNVDNYKDQLEKTVANIEVDEADLGDAIQTLEYLPTINREATDVKGVYSLKSMIPKNVVKSLETVSESLLVAEEDEINTCEYVKEQILQVCKGDNNTKAITILLILDGLINLNKAQVKQISQKSFQPSAYSAHLNEYLMENFTIKSEKSRTRPLSMKDKNTCYIIALSLLINEYKVSLDALTTLLKPSKKKLMELCRVLLLQVKGSTASVVLPLPAPISPKKVRK